MPKNGKSWKNVFFALVILTAVTFCGGIIYLNSTGYKADGAAQAALEGDGGVTVTRPVQEVVVFLPEEPKAGLVFYPGGRVEHTAYAPLLLALAQEGIVCVLPEMPLDLAVLDMDAADCVRELVAGIQTWYLGGHSLGGAMAASYAARHSDDYEGLVLLAAYSTEDLGNRDMKVISLYGSEDDVLDMDRDIEYRNNLPGDTVEAILEGGNHAQFGSDGPQEGDGAAAVTRDGQIAWAVEIIAREILKSVESM